MSLRKGVVVDYHPEDHSVDLIMVKDNSRLAGVQVLTCDATSRSGLNRLTKPGAAASGDKWSITDVRDPYIIAAVDDMDRTPVVVGFMFPQVSELLFQRENFHVDRHPSDLYSTINDAADFELSHPSGSFFRLAESPDHEDLSGQDFDAKWKIARNTGRAPWISFSLRSNGTEVMKFQCDPSGNITLTHAGNFSMTTGGAATWTVAGAMRLVASSLELAAPTDVSGASLTHGGTNVGKTHVHGGVTPGPSDSGGPH